MKYFLTIAASDNSGGAGIQQDLKVAEDMGYWGLSAITGITVQDFDKVSRIYPVSSEVLTEQIEKCIKSFDASAVKIGAVCSDENIIAISGLIKKYKLKNIVLDTVFSPTRGSAFIGKKSIELFRNKLLPVVRIITPNKNELSLLSGKKMNTLKDCIVAAKELSLRYNCDIYITGGHFDGKIITEALVQKNKVTLFAKERLNLKYSHGTGCAFSSALSCLINDNPVKDSCEKASEYVSKLYKNFQ